MWRRGSAFRQPFFNNFRRYNSYSGSHDPPIKPKKAIKSPLISQSADDDEISKELKAIRKIIEKACGKELFYWSSFPIEIPKSENTETLFLIENLNENESILKESNEAKKIISIEGNNKLTKEQLEEIRKTGRFKTTDLNGKEHIWEINSLLITGSNFYNNLCKDSKLTSGTLMYRSIHHIISDDEISLKKSLHLYKLFIKEFFHLTIGYPIKKMIKSDEKKKIKLRFIYENYLHSIANLKLDIEKKSNDFTFQILDYLGKVQLNSTNSQNPTLDARYFVKDFSLQSDVLLYSLEKQISKQWNTISQMYIDEFTRDEKHHKNKNYFTNEFKEIIIPELRKLYEQLLLQVIDINKDKIDKSMGKDGTSLIKSIFLTGIIRNEEKLLTKLNLQQLNKEIEEKLKQSNPFKSNIPFWLNKEKEKLIREELKIPNDQSLNNFFKQNEIQNSIKKIENFMKNNNFLEKNHSYLHITNYDKLNEQKFLLERELEWKKQKNQILNDNRTNYQIYTAIPYVFPSNFKIIEKSENSTVELDLNSFSSGTLIPVTNPANDSTRSIKNYKLISFQSNFWGWRLKKYFYSSKKIFKNNARTLHSTMFESKASINILTPENVNFFHYNRPIYSKDSILIEKPKFEKLSSILNKIWDYVRESREKFKNTESIFLPRNLTNAINFTWNYIVVGPLCTTLAVFGIPLLVVSINVACVVGQILNFSAIPLYGICTFLSQNFKYDTVTRQISPFTGVITNFVSATLSGSLSILAVPLCPIGSILHYGSYHLTTLFGNLFDSLRFYLLIKPFGKSPQQDEYLVRRVKGPGLAEIGYFSLDIKYILLCVYIYLEKELLNNYTKVTKNQIDFPNQLYSQFIRHVISPPLGNIHGDNYRLQNTTREYNKQLHSELKKRYDSLPKIESNKKLLEKFRIHENEFDQMMFIVTDRTKNFITQKIFVEQFQNNESFISSFWESNHLQENDWAGYVKKMLTGIFSDAFIVPISSQDESVEFVVDHAAKLDNFVKMIASFDPHDDLDYVNRKTTVPISALSKEFDIPQSEKDAYLAIIKQSCVDPKLLEKEKKI